MTSILISAGFRYVESLKEFSMRFPDLPICNDDEFEKILVCHTTNAPDFDGDSSAEERDRQCLLDAFRKRLEKKDLLKTVELETTPLFDKIFDHFKASLTNYIVRKCFIFYDWGWNSIEVLTDGKYVHKKISAKLENEYLPPKTEIDGFRRRWKAKTTGKQLNLSQSLVFNSNEDQVPNSKQQHKESKKKRVSVTALNEATSSMVPWADLSRNLCCSLQETFNLKKILYDYKIRSRWPRNHIFSKNDVNDLLKFIVNLGPKCRKTLNVGSTLERPTWIFYKNFLQLFLDNHLKVEKNNGYGRILMKHLKNAEPSTDTRLVPVSVFIVSSYVLDILRRVIPVEFYPSNRIKRKFFSSVVKILRGRLEENFIWEPYLRNFIENEGKLTWCEGIKDGGTRKLVITNTLKFIILHYVFAVVRNNFYVTETGRSCRDLRFYRKPDVRKGLRVFRGLLALQKRIRSQKKDDLCEYSAERHWIETGMIDSYDSRVFMGEGTDFRQAVASVRFVPKNDCCRLNEMRIITSFRNETKVLKPSEAAFRLVERFKKRSAERKKMLGLVNLFLECLIEKTGTGIEPVPQNPELEKIWLKVIEMKRKFGRVYFVKADIKDAFDSVVHDKLVQVLWDRIHEGFGMKEFVELKNITEWRMVKGRLKRKFRSSFSSRPKKNSILLHRSERSEENRFRYRIEKFVEIIRQVALEQRLEINGKIVMLSKGLAQGGAGRLSPHLCEIYYASMDKTLFEEYLNSEDCVLMRGVDDYLLITPKFDVGKRFLGTALAGVPDFNVKFRKRKLKTNLFGSPEEVSYLGLIFDFDKMSVRPDYSKYEGKNLLRTMKLSDKMGNVHFKKCGFFDWRISKLNSLKVHPIVLGDFNGSDVLKVSIFQACIVQSLRILSLAEYLFDGKSNMAVANGVFRSLKKIKRLTESSLVSREEVTWIFFQAVVMTFRKRCGKFQALLRILRFHLERWEGKVFKGGETRLEKPEKRLKFGVHENVRDFLNGILDKKQFESFQVSLNKV